MGSTWFDRFARLTALLVIALAPMACVLHCRAAAAVDARHAFDSANLHFLHLARDDAAESHQAHAPLTDLLQLVKAVTQWLPVVAVYVATLIAIARLAARAQPALTPFAVAPAIPPPRASA